MSPIGSPVCLASAVTICTSAEPVIGDELGRHGRMRRVSVQAHDPAAG